MVTEAEFRRHYENLYNTGAIYIWGGNCETITQILTDKLYKTFGSSKYNKTYYDNKYKEGKGHIGADCSGSIYPLSKNDTTANGYYHDQCKTRGTIGSIPMDKCCLVFNKNFTHVGAYQGNGYTIEMKSSAENCVKQKFDKSRWAYWGIPTWLSSTGTSSSTTTLSASLNQNIIKNIQIWANGYLENTEELVVDGKYGPKTKKALCKCMQKFLNKQYNLSLEEDGELRSKTKQACVRADKHKVLMYICQAMLYLNGYNMSHSIKNENLDGKYGTGTKNSIKEFQSNNGLSSDGICGPATFERMFK